MTGISVAPVFLWLVINCRFFFMVNIPYKIRHRYLAYRNKEVLYI